MPKLYLAPLQGLTDCYYREQYALHFAGIDAAFSPFIADVSTTRVSPSKLMDIHPTLNRNIKTIPQFLSKNPEEIVILAQVIKDLGYNEMNWNIGCPFSKVANKQRGSGILPYPLLIAEIMEKIMPVLPIGLSVKMRLGYFTTDEIFPILEIFNQYPLSEIIIHTRTGKQMYKGETHPDKYRECLQKSKNPLVYNGDIFALEDYQKLSVLFPETETWMLGRGVLRDPFLPAKIKGLLLPDMNERKKVLIKFHHALYYKYQTLEKAKFYALDRMKGIWVYLQHSFEDSSRFSKSVFKARTEDDFFNAVNQIMQLELIP